MKTKSIAMLCARRDHEAREGSAELPFGTMQARWMEATKPTGRTENTEPNWSSALRKRTLFPATALFAVLLIASSPLASADDSLSEALQKGLLEEEANHNLEAAIQAYQEAVNQFGDQRKIAATAVFRLGECYRKQGKTNEAAAHYERLCRDFPDQQQLVQLGQKYLMEWQRIGGAEGRSGDRVAPDQQLLDPDQVKLVQEEIKLAELQAADAKKSYESGKGALTDVIKAKRDLLALRRMLPENAAPAQRKALIEEEIKYVEQLLKEVQKTVEVGAAPVNSEIPLKRDLLALRRELAAVGSLSQQPGAAGSFEQRQVRQQASTDEEAKEVERLKEVIRNSPDLINAKRDGYAPLHNAANKGQLVVARFLLDNGASINARNNSGETPLHLAVSQGHKAMVELLLSGGADVNARAAHGDAPLHYAAAKGFMAVAKVLLEKGGEVNARDENDRTPLHQAVANGFKGMVELLLANKADPNIAYSFRSRLVGDPNKIPVSGTPLHLAVTANRDGDEELVELLLKNGAQVDSTADSGWTPLHVASNLRRGDIARLLLKWKADVNVRGQGGRSALLLAVLNEDRDLAKLLLDHGADVNNQTDDQLTALMWAVLNGSSEMTALLLSYKPNLELRDAQGLTPMQVAVSRQQIKLVEMLLKSGADPNARIAMNLNRTILHWAAAGAAAGQSLDKRMLETILASNADVNARDDTGRTPLHLAVAAQWIDAADLLLAHGGDVDAKTKEGYSPLHVAAGKPDAKMAALLLKNKAVVNTQDERGNTPLHYAAFRGAKEVVELLLADQADVNLANKEGATALKMMGVAGRAFQNGDLGIPVEVSLPQGPQVIPPRLQDVANLLRQHGAKEKE